MINIKNKEEIKKMKKGGRILADVMKKLLKITQVGTTEEDIENLADKLIIEKGAFPGFKRVKGYNWATCISTNDEVVHGLPGKYVFKEGDVVCIDCGVFYEGFNTDMAETVEVKSHPSDSIKPRKLKVKNNDVNKFLETGRVALNNAIKQAVPGNRIGHISKTIQEIVEKQGYSIVRSLVGHGVGKDLHEQPEIPGFVNRKLEDTPLLQEGMTLAIEVIYNMGKRDVKYSDDGWTIKTKDKSFSAVFEKTILVEKSRPIVLT
ncbi:type I methionyl aminopeptidase [Patescibacteria group bacterium]|nr:type I methionyl aminopeptidase [Patescibacteria group bacterium]